MRYVQGRIDGKQAAFARHAFFERISAAPSFEDMMGFAPALSFWVMAFQDALRLGEQLTRDPELRRIVRHHRAEDAGHERWFLADLAHLRLPQPDLPQLFGRAHAGTRDATYSLMSEVFRAQDDRVRVVMLMTLESAGHVFFDRTARLVDRAGMSQRLQYFSFSHLEVEKRHQVFEDELNRRIAAIELPRAVRDEALAVVDRCYEAFHGMFDSLLATVETSFPRAATA
jgi:hypothetical protein